MKSIFEYRQIIWDWNGTLLDDCGLVAEIVNHELERSGIAPVPVEVHRELFSHPIAAYYERLGVDFQVRSFADLAQDFFIEYEQRWRECQLHNGVSELLEELRARNTTQSIISAHHHHHVLEQVTHHQLHLHLDDVQGLQQDAGGSKISLAKEWFTAREIHPERILVVGDTEHDHEVAAALGADCILVSHGFQSHEVLSRVGVPVIRSLAELR